MDELQKLLVQLNESTIVRYNIFLELYERAGRDKIGEVTDTIVKAISFEDVNRNYLFKKILGGALKCKKTI